MGTAVALTSVSKSFGAIGAVKRLTLEVREGEFITLLGPSGCGKTTTLRLISGFEVPEEGTVTIAGQIVNHVPPYRRNVNTVFQNYALFPHLTVFENVAYGLTLKRLPRRAIRQKVLDMLDRVSLADKAASMPRQLSGGQMQRIALARAIINEPSVLLLDEPLGSLDAKLRKAMQIELKHVHKSLGITFIYVTHDQEEALVMSDRIAVMNRGRIAQLGNPEEIFDRPGDQFVAEFIGTANFIPGRVAEIGSSGHLVALDHGPLWKSSVPSTTVPGDKVTVAIRPQKIRATSHAGGFTNGHNTFQARLREIIYVGAWVRLVLEVGTDVTIVVENTPENLPFDYRNLRRGDQIFLEVAPSATLLFPGRAA